LKKIFNEKKHFTKPEAAKEMENSIVKAWKEKVVIPTYEAGAPDKNPMFFEKRVYQGSSGVVYPNPVIEKIYDEKKDKEYIGLFLENDYLKIMILPELGGRVHMAFDKIRQRHFIYYNQVIKPALVGLCGPWISGGIEFNWPQHHRPSTFEAVDYSIEDNEDGSKTIWVNEVERMFRTKGMAGFTLHPDKAYLEIKVKLYNRTPLPQTFLWWANPAVKVNDHYQSVFPPDVNAVFDHGKRDVSTFPIATGTYYKVNYAPGTDISRYKNIPVPTSYMAINSDYDFVGGYEHDTNAGLLHVADHHVSPGKKQWTWGNGDFGQAWDRNLTDEDGPYIELMTGVFTDNQPDFSWLMPYEEKSFTQYFLPYHELGVVKNASKDLLVNVEKVNGELQLKILATSKQKIKVRMLYEDSTLINNPAIVRPEEVLAIAVEVSKDVTDKNIMLIISDEHGAEVLRYDPKSIKQNKIPEPAKHTPAPKDIENNEQLFLAGLHLEQYRHASYSAVPYYEEALRRDPKDIRNNNALGLWYFRKGQFAKSETYFRKAIETATQRNPNPYDTEPYYNLGLCLKMQGKQKEAYRAFYKSVWNSAWQASGYFSIAQIDMTGMDYQKALGHIEYSLDRNARNGKAYFLKIAALRKLQDYTEALNTCAIALKKDQFNLGVYFEQFKIYQALNNEVPARNVVAKLNELARGHIHSYIEYALDYVAAGLFEEAVELLEQAFGDNNKVYPMIWYYLGWLHYQLKNENEGHQYFTKAAIADADHCFPNRLEDIAVLQLASEKNPSDAKAPYYLGNLWYDKRQYKEAIEQWELSAKRDDQFPTVFRNLGIAYFNKQNDAQKALTAYEKSFSINPFDARVLMELDQLYKRLNKEPKERLAFLEKHLEVVAQRDDLYLERAALYNFLGDHEKAFELIMQKKFHPWEGGEGKVSGQYVYSLVEMAKQFIHSGDFKKAIDLLEQAQTYPHNLGEGKLYGAQENDIFYWMACAYEESGNRTKAMDFFEKGTQGLSEPAAAMFYNDQQPDKIFYQGLAWNKLGKKEKAAQIFSKLVEYGLSHLNEDVKIDYFAVSLPDLLIFEDDLNARNKIHCHYMMGLGYLGLSETENAKTEFKQALQNDAMHFGSKTHLKFVQQLKEQAITTQAD
jgi:tetratricopeptide (TPR) repeat protein